MNKTFKQVFDGIRKFFDRLIVVSILFLVMAILWSPSYVPAAQGFGDQMGNWWILWRGTIFLVTTIIIIVGIALHFVYIVDENKVGNVRIMGRKTQRVLSPGPHLLVPYINVVEEKPTNAQSLRVEVTGVEVQKSWHFNVTTEYTYKLVPQNSWCLLDNVAYGDVSNLLRGKITEIAKAVYRGIDLDSFWGNQTEQKIRETQFLAEVVVGVNELMLKLTGESDIFTMSFIGVQYAAPEYQTAAEKRNAAEIRKQELEAEGEGQKKLSMLLTEAKAYETLQLGLQRAEVQKALGQVLKDNPGLTVFEAVQHLPQYLSLGTGSSFDLMGFMAAFNMMYGGKMPSSSSTVTPPYTGPSGSLPTP